MVLEISPKNITQIFRRSSFLGEVNTRFVSFEPMASFQFLEFQWRYYHLRQNYGFDKKNIKQMKILP